MKINLERNQARIIVSGSGSRACPRSLSAKRELRRSGGKRSFPTCKFAALESSFGETES